MSKRKPHPEKIDKLDKAEVIVKPIKKKRENCKLDLFNPKSFDKDSTYDGIVDSSDSTDDPIFIPPEDNEIVISSDKNPSDNDDTEEEIGESEDTSDENYFMLNKQPLVKIITQTIKNKLPAIAETDLNDAVKAALNEAHDGLVAEYCGAVPKDKHWKMDLTPEEAQTFESHLDTIREKIKIHQPTMVNILKSNLSMIEKERALQLFDILNNCEPYTEKYLEIASRISFMLEMGPKTKDTDCDEKLTNLYEKFYEDMPTLDKIAGAFLTTKDKIRAIELFETIDTVDYKSDRWFSVNRRINQIIESQYASLEEVNKMEAEEKLLTEKTIKFHGDLKKEIFELNADVEVKRRILEMYHDMMECSPEDSKYGVLKAKIIWSLKLPHRKMAVSPMSLIALDKKDEIQKYCRHIYDKLNEEIYGMVAAKEKILQLINNRIYNPKSRSIIALKGKPGVGKTILAKTIASAVGLPFDKINLGGAVDASIFKGTDNVWIGSSPSMLLQILSRVHYSNAVVLLDEIDKLGVSNMGLEVQHALLHVLDNSQNKEFQDSFISEYSHDISNIWFIVAMNDDETLDPALRDRLDIIDVPSYTRSELVEIVKLHTFPKILTELGIIKSDLLITDKAIEGLIASLGSEIKESGMRPIENRVKMVVSRINLLYSLGKDTIPLSYEVKDFEGFPYTISDKTINSICKEKKDTTPHSYDTIYI